MNEWINDLIKSTYTINIVQFHLTTS